MIQSGGAKSSVWTIMGLLKWSTDYFKSHDIESPRAASEILLAHSLHLKRIDLYLKYDTPLTSKELAAYKSLIKRRVKREPVAYIVEEKEFFSLTFRVSSSVLVPRPETECLVEEALRLCGQMDTSGLGPLNILELGTGSGAIVVTVAHKRPDDCYFASDISFPAITLAKENAKRHQVDQFIRFFVCDWFSAIDSENTKMDVILSNPPYIKSKDLSTLQPEVKDFEPRLALDGHDDGLAAIQEILTKGRNYLKDGGVMILEIGADQKEDVLEIINHFDCFVDIEVIKDYSGRDRILRVKKCLGPRKKRFIPN